MQIFSPSEVCSVDCGTHGVCMGGACRCEEGWTGAGCDQRVCNPLCIKHGTCKDGKCQCHQGWNGEHCTIGECAPVSVCLEVCVWRACLCVNTWVCTETPAPSQTKMAAPLYFLKGIWKSELEAGGRPWGIEEGADVEGGRAERRGANFLEVGVGDYTRAGFSCFMLPLNCRPQEF